MNVKKLSLASLLLMACSFGWAETSTFVKVTKESQLVPGNRYVILYHYYQNNESKTAALSVVDKGIAHDVEVNPSTVGTTTMSLISTEIGTSTTPTAFLLGTTEDGSYTLYSDISGHEGYLTFKSNGNHQTQLTSSSTPWTITANDDGTFTLSSGNFYLYTKHYDDQGTPQFEGSTSTISSMELYLEYGGGTVVEQTMITFGRSTVADESGEIDTKYYASVCFDHDFMLDNNITAYGIEETFTAPFSGYVPLTLTKVQDPYEMVWAESPVLLVIENDDPDAPAELEYPIYLMNSATTDNTFETNLVGTLEETDAPENSYQLGRIDDVVGFWYAYGNGTIKANKAYIQAAEGSEIKGFTFNFADATGIKAVSAPEVNNDAIYNLVGQQVTKNYKGVVVKNGKKFLNK